MTSKKIALIAAIIVIGIFGFVALSSTAVPIPVEPEPAPPEPDQAEETISEIEPADSVEGNNTTESPEYNTPVIEGPQTSDDILGQFE